jgi:ceramide glucosyltransferase
VQAVTLLTLLPTATALALYLVMMVTFARAVLSKRRAGEGEPLERAPRVSIYKPLAGADDDLAGNLASFAAIDYPSYEVLFGVASATDPAAAVARAFLQAHPKVCARLVLTDPSVAVNPKVAQLLALDRRATGDIVVISDSNVRVPPSYLWPLARALAEPEVGLVTNIFVGTGERSIGAALENLQLGSVTAPGVVAASRLLKEPLTIGKSMAMRRRDVARLGVLHAVTDVLAEDHVLGRVFLNAGFAVRTSLETVENRNVACSLRRTLERHSRWAKMRRSITPVGFALEPFLSPLTIASVVAVLAQSRLSLAVVLVAALLQTTFAFAAIKMLRGRTLAWYYAPLELVRTYVTLACWARAWCSRRIAWRGHEFLLAEGSAIVPAPPRSWSRLTGAVRA